MEGERGGRSAEGWYRGTGTVHIWSLGHMSSIPSLMCLAELGLVYDMIWAIEVRADSLEEMQSWRLLCSYPCGSHTAISQLDSWNPLICTVGSIFTCLCLRAPAYRCA